MKTIVLPAKGSTAVRTYRFQGLWAAVLLLVLLVPGSAIAQEEIPTSLSLQAAIRIGLRSSPLLQAELNNRALAKVEVLHSVQGPKEFKGNGAQGPLNVRHKQNGCSTPDCSIPQLSRSLESMNFCKIAYVS